MKTEPIINKLDLKLLSGTAPDEFFGVYVGDFLSRAMSRIECGDLWITIMSNINTVAVASLTDCAAIILAEGVSLPEDALKAAKEKEITVFSSPLSAYEICSAVHDIESMQGKEG